MPQGSPLWQGILFLCAALFLLWETWRGWRAGIFRSGINFAALFVSGIFGLFAGQLTASLFGGVDSFNGLVAGLLVGGFVCTFVFLALWLAGAILFKRTEHQGSGILRFFWGVGGAFFGFLIGCAIIWGCISGIRAFGTFAQATIQGSNDFARSQNQPAPTPAPVIRTIAELKESLELGPTGKLVESVDIVPPDTYKLLLDTVRLSNDPAAMSRFIQYPGVEKLLDNPKLQELLNNPDIMKASEKRDFMALVNSKDLRALLEDPDLARQVGSIDLRAALKFALEQPTPTPAPSPNAKKKN